MKLQILSDVHYDISSYTYHIKNYGADILILAGDICNGDNSSPGWYRRRIEEWLSDFDQVIVVPGNHDFYGTEYDDRLALLRETFACYDNAHFLHNEFVDIGGVSFYGGPMWTSCNKMNPITTTTLIQNFSDFNWIWKGAGRFLPQDANALLEDFKNNYIMHQDNTKKCVVISHHAPSYNSVHKNYRTGTDYHYNFAFFEDMDEFIMEHEEIALWIHGHMHNQFDYMIGKTRVVCNPRGYERYKENTGFDPRFIAEV